MTVSILGIAGRPDECTDLAEDFLSLLAYHSRMVVPVGLGEVATDNETVLLAGDTIMDMVLNADDLKCDVAFVVTGVTSQSRIRMLFRAIPVLLKKPNMDIRTVLVVNQDHPVDTELVQRIASYVPIQMCSVGDVPSMAAAVALVAPPPEPAP